MDAYQIEQIADGAMARLTIPDELANLAEDIRQDIAIAIVEAMAEGRSHLPTIAYRSGLRAMAEYARQGGYDDLYARLKNDGRAQRQILPRHTPSSAEPTIEDREIADAAKKHLGRLDEQAQRAIRLCVMGGVSQEDAAQIIGVPQYTISRMISTGLADIREAMKKYT